jgi:hypothetical protein
VVKYRTGSGKLKEEMIYKVDGMKTALTEDEVGGNWILKFR